MPDPVVTPAGVVPQPRAGIGQVLRDQRKAVVVGLVLAVASFWILGQLGEWRLAISLSVGVALGLLNHLVTERWLLGLLTTGREPTRAVMIRSTMVRLLALTAVAVTVAVVFWPDGIGVLLGLAVFRLIALAMTTIPLLKELKSQ